MIFTTKEDIEAPIDAVFLAVSNFGIYERAALRRGADIRRVTHSAGPAPHLGWDAAFKFRGKRRILQASLEEFDAPNRLLVHSVSGGLAANALLDLTALSRGQTRLFVSFEMKPQTLTARLLVQSMRLAKAKLNAGFKMKIAKYANKIEDDYKTSRSR